MVSQRTIIIGLSIVLAIAMLGGNIAMGLDRGPMSSDHVKDTAESEGLYDAIHEEMLETILEEMEPADDLPEGLDTATIVEDTVTVGFVQQQLGNNIDTTYAYFGGDVDTIELYFDLEDLSQNLRDSLVEQISDMSADELGLGELYLDEYGVTLDIDRLLADADGFAAERTTFEEAIKEHIQEETPHEMSDEELDEAYNDIRDDLHQEVTEHAQTAIGGHGFPGELHEPLTGFAATIADGYVAEIDYDEFEAAIEDDQEAIGQAIGDHILDETGDDQRIVFLETEDADELAPVKTAFSTIGMLAWLLPLIALGIVGGMYYLVRDETAVATPVGIVALVVGVIGAILATVVPSVAFDMADLDLNGDLTTAVEGFVAGLFDPLFTQSIVLAGLGVVLIGVAYAINNGYILTDEDAVTATEGDDD